MLALFAAWPAYYQLPASLQDYRRPALATRRAVALAKLAEPDVRPATQQLNIVHHSDDDEMITAKLPPPPSPPPPSEDDGLAEGRLLMLVVAMLWGTNFPLGRRSWSLVSRRRWPQRRVSRWRRSHSPMLTRPIHDEEGGRLRPPIWCSVGWVAMWLAGVHRPGDALQGAPAGVVAFLASLQVVFVPCCSCCWATS